MCGLGHRLEVFSLGRVICWAENLGPCPAILSSWAHICRRSLRGTPKSIRTDRRRQPGFPAEEHSYCTIKISLKWWGKVESSKIMAIAQRLCFQQQACWLKVHWDRWWSWIMAKGLRVRIGPIWGRWWKEDLIKTFCIKYWGDRGVCWKCFNVYRFFALLFSVERVDLRINS